MTRLPDRSVQFPLTAISLTLALGAVVWLNCPASLHAQTVRLHGAVTLSKLITDQKAALETQTGLKLEIVGNGSGCGLAALAAGEADIAMLAGSIKGVADAMNKEKAGSVDIAGLKDTPLPGVKLVFVIHPSAGVKSLTQAQAHDLLSGKVAAALNEIVTKARQVDELAAEVANASREQTQDITQINVAVGQMDQVTQSNAASAEESAAAAAELHSQAGAMKQSVSELLQLIGGNLRQENLVKPSAKTRAPVKADGNAHAHPVKSPAPVPALTAGKRASVSLRDASWTFSHESRVSSPRFAVKREEVAPPLFSWNLNPLSPPWITFPAKVRCGSAELQSKRCA